MIAFLRLWLLSLCLVLLAAAPVRAAGRDVVIVSSERSAAYQEATDALLKELERAGLDSKDVMQFTAADLPKPEALAPRVFIALGTEAAARLAGSDVRVPVLCTLLPRLSFERVLRESGRRSSDQFTALYLNQPPTRQLELVRLALPQVRRVGVLFGPESRSQESSLTEAAQSRGLKIEAVQVEQQEPVYGALKKILDDADLLLAVADPQVYNSNSIQNILMASFRAQVPMLAFSPAYVRAGALLAVYSTPAQIGQQAGVMARGLLQGKALGMPQYPQDFSISVNENVARSLGLNLEPQTLTERLRRLEKKP
jgi:putative ABC transport system substrate-binding protein